MMWPSRPSTSHIVKMKSLNADVFVDVTITEIRGAGDQEDGRDRLEATASPTNVSVSVGAVIKPAGIDASQGIISSAYLKDPTDPHWKNDPGMKAWNDFLDKYYPEANRADSASHLRLHGGSNSGACTEGLRRQSHARERDEAGRHPQGP